MISFDKSDDGGWLIWEEPDHIFRGEVVWHEGLREFTFVNRDCTLTTSDLQEILAVIERIYRMNRRVIDEPAHHNMQDDRPTPP